MLAGFCIKEDELPKLEKLRLKDSKLLTPKQRERFFKKIIGLSKNYKVAVVSAQEIDSRLDVGLNLNQLEALKAAELIDELFPDVVYVDSPVSPDGTKFASMIKKNLLHKNVEIIAEHKADVKYPVVSAASILAKVIRDEEVEIIKKEIGADFGSGYPSDEKTMKFVREHWENSLARYIRKSWGTIKELEKMRGQKTLEGYD